MKVFRTCLALILALIFASGGLWAAQASEDQDRNESPYFFIQSDDPEVDRLPLKSTSAQVNISGVIADVTVTQVYQNEGKRPIEAVYVFPASTRAAVYGMKMTIGKRVITAEIKKRDEARQAYEQAKKEGKSASLLEQERPNVFRMNVANVLPGDRIVVELKYTELLVPEDKEYAFVYPTVVGPRYVSKEQSTHEKWTANPYLHQGNPPTCGLDISLRVTAGMPIKEITCPSHKVDITWQDKSSALVHLDKTEKAGGNRDFICKYRLSGNRIESGLLISQGDKENFFLLMLQPPERVPESAIPPREYVFIVDVSGSMHGFPLNISKKLVSDLIGHLRPVDRFNVLLFSGSASVMAERSLPADAKNIRRAMDLIDNQQGGGGTELLPALKKALSLPGTEGYSRTFVIMTDGYVSVEAEAFDFIRENLDRANMFAFGIGSSVNRHLIEGMARAGMGEPYILTSPEEAPAKADKFRRLISTPALTGINVEFKGLDVYDVEPAHIPDLLADRPIIVYGKWRGRPAGSILVSGSTGKKQYTERLEVRTFPIDRSSPALRYMWARNRISLLSDYNNLRQSDERVNEITTLGLTYNLLTAYTSFIAVDTQVRLKDGKAVTVKQPLPLPQGVSDLAVGENYACAKAMSPSALPVMQERAAKDEAGWGRVPLHAEKERERSVRVENVRVSPGLNAVTVKRILEDHAGELRRCLAGMNAVKGKIVFSFTMDRQGKVTAVTVGRPYQDLKECLFSVLKAMVLPVSEGTKPGTVTCTLTIG